MNRKTHGQTRLAQQYSNDSRPWLANHSSHSFLVTLDKYFFPDTSNCIFKTAGAPAAGSPAAGSPAAPMSA